MVKLKLLRFFLFLVFITSYELRVTSYELFAQDNIIAIVNNDVITQKDLNDFINFMRMQLQADYKGEELENKVQSMKLDLLDRLIEDRLILQEARKNNIKIDENRVKEKIDAVKKRYASDKEFQDALKRQGQAQADIELRIREQLLMYNVIELKVKNNIQVKPTEVTEFYEKNSDEFIIPEAREFISINTADKSMADEIFSELKNGQDFDDTAGKYSLKVNKLNAHKGKELRGDIEKIIFSLKSSEVSLPLEVDGSFYIFKLANIIPFRKLPLSVAQDKIYAFLFEQKMQEELARWLDELKKKSYIKII